MASILQQVNTVKWTGVFCYASENKKHRGKPDVCYYITFKVDGFKKTEKVGWRSEGYSPEVAAELRANRVKTARHKEKVQSAKEIRFERQKTNRTIGELRTAYFESERGLNLKGRTTDLNRYEKHLQKAFSRKRVDTLSPLDVERVKRDMRDHAPATVFNTLELLRRLINYGVEQGLCLPLSFKIKFPKKDNEVTEYLTPEEAQSLMEVLERWPSKDVSRMLQVVWLTGLRRGEIFKLADRDCDFVQKIIRLRNPKGGRTTEIPMSEPVETILQAQMAWREKRFPGCLFLFPGRYGKQRIDSSAVDRIKTEAKLPKSFRIFHGLRHHMAVTLANSGEFTIDMIGELLTHKNHAMTKRYVDFLPGAKKKAASRAAELLKAHATDIQRKNVGQLEDNNNG
ncbi:MAG: site-specific integrase [Nitrospira sp.]|nr:site-specific integrase [Candidatus Manganitrophaceae bacterium]HIL34987.1 site-specific integrase [Candidatus Manganitrophaceae bacterium]